MLNDMPKNYLKLLPRFSGDKKGPVEENISGFHDFTNNFMVEDDDVFMRLFVQTVEGDVKKWFLTLPTNSLHLWDDLEITFNAQWVEKKYF